MYASFHFKKTKAQYRKRQELKERFQPAFRCRERHYYKIVNFNTMARNEV